MTAIKVTEDAKMSARLSIMDESTASEPVKRAPNILRRLRLTASATLAAVAVFLSFLLSS